jgi:nicotinamide-nucleotide amidase
VVVTTADEVVAACIDRELTIGTAESVTAGLVAATIAAVPGCSAVFRGGVVSYNSDIKQSLLGVAPELLSHVVTASVAEAMALGAQQVLQVDLAVATTGVAGPDWLDNQPPGRVWIAAGLAGGPMRTRMLDLPGDRAQIRSAASQAALHLALEIVTDR